MCIHHTNLKMDWYNAQDYCQSLGADLANVMNGDEMYEVVLFMQIPPFMKSKNFGKLK